MRRPLPKLVRSTPLLLGGAALMAFAVALALAPPETAHPALLPVLLGCAMAAALHRPWGPLGLGMGAAVLPLATYLFGPAGAGACAVVASLTATLWSAAQPGGVGRGWRLAMEPAAGHALAAMAGAALWRALADSSLGAATAAGGGVYVLALLGLAAMRRRLSPYGPRLARGDLAAAAGMEGGAWAAGALLTLAALRAGEPVALGLLAVMALLAAEAARQGRRGRLAEAGRSALERLGHAGARLVRDPSPVAKLAHQVHRECRQVLPFSWFSFELLESAGGAVAGSWHAGPDGRLQPGSPRPPDHPPPLPGIHRRTRWQVVRRALVAGDRHLGDLDLWCDPRRVSQEEIALVDRLVPQLAGLVHRSLLDREAREDPLTGVALRRVLDLRLTELWQRCLHEGGALGVVLVDLDFFKRINDRYGHAAGDRALIAVAAVLGANLRDQDLCARYGGEEFALLLEGLDGAAALAIAERLRCEVEALRVDSDGTLLELSLSAGVASFPEVHCRDPQELVQLADAALYEAKRLGRNCCLLYCGGGSYLDPKGRRVDTAEAEEAAAPRAPQFFA